MVYKPDLITTGEAKNMKNIVTDSGLYTMGRDYLNKWEWGVIHDFRSSTLMGFGIRHWDRKYFNWYKPVNFSHDFKK